MQNKKKQKQKPKQQKWKNWNKSLHIEISDKNLLITIGDRTVCLAENQEQQNQQRNSINFSFLSRAKDEKDL